MPHQTKGGWRWGDVVRPTKGELVKVVYGIWQMNGANGRFEDFWKTGKTTAGAPQKSLDEALKEFLKGKEGE